MPAEGEVDGVELIRNALTQYDRIPEVSELLDALGERNFKHAGRLVGELLTRYEVVNQHRHNDESGEETVTPMAGLGALRRVIGGLASCRSCGEMPYVLVNVPNLDAITFEIRCSGCGRGAGPLALVQTALESWRLTYGHRVHEEAEPEQVKPAASDKGHARRLSACPICTKEPGIELGPTGTMRIMCTYCGAGGYRGDKGPVYLPPDLAIRRWVDLKAPELPVCSKCGSRPCPPVLIFNGRGRPDEWVVKCGGCARPEVCVSDTAIGAMEAWARRNEQLPPCAICGTMPTESDSGPVALRWVVKCLVCEKERQDKGFGSPSPLSRGDTLREARDGWIIMNSVTLKDVRVSAALWDAIKKGAAEDGMRIDAWVVKVLTFGTQIGRSPK